MRTIVKGISIISLIAIFSASQTIASDFDTNVDTLTQTNNAQNSLALAIDKSKAAAGVNSACGVKGKRVTQTNNAQNSLALAIKNSSAVAGSNIAGNCMK
ncbi:MAG: hypothetical protein KTR21_00260 [Rhodobacteraceae bacterium]|nr:hypothetical protein [Paracoccaceae bacterium]